MYLRVYDMLMLFIVHCCYANVFFIIKVHHGLLNGLHTCKLYVLIYYCRNKQNSIQRRSVQPKHKGAWPNSCECVYLQENMKCSRFVICRNNHLTWIDCPLHIHSSQLCSPAGNTMRTRWWQSLFRHSNLKKQEKKNTYLCLGPCVFSNSENLYS